MPTQIILSVIDPYILLAIGVALIAFEAVIASFVLIWFDTQHVIKMVVENPQACLWDEHPTQFLQKTLDE